MKQVTQQQFFEFVGNKDACIRIENEYQYPYTTIFELRHSRKILGKRVDSYTDEIEKLYPLITKYYIENEAN